MAPPPPSDAVELYGRDHELAQADGFLDDAAHSASGLLLEGDSGIGKTVLWRAIVARARQRGFRVLACQADQAEARLSFIGLADLIGGLAAQFLPSLSEIQRQALAVALLLEVPPEGRGPDPRAVAGGFTSMLSELTADSPVLIAVDDLQWLDTPTAKVLAFAARRLRDRPAGLLCTSRIPPWNVDRLGLERAFGDRLKRLHIGALDPHPLRMLLDRAGGHKLARPVMARILAASDGNPLFALELMNALASNRELEPTMHLPVPERLRALIAERIPNLRPRAREALLVAAALSHPSVELVERASSASALAEAEESGLIRIDDGRVRFRHPLYASAVYSAAATSRRRKLHQRLAELVSDEEERARHLAMATSHPDDTVATELERGAVLASARGAWDSAAELLEQAKRLTAPDERALRSRRTIAAAEHHIHAGDRARARALLEDVLAEGVSEADRGEALRLLAEITYNDDNYIEAQRLLEQALQLTDDSGRAVTIELALSYVHANLGDFASSREFAYHALQRTRAIRDEPLVAEALATCAMTDFLCGRGVDWTKVERALQLEDRRRLVPLHNRPSTIAATLTFYVGRLSEARQQLLTLHSWARERGDESDLAWVGTTLSWLETMAGQFEVALRFAEESELVSRLTGSDSGQAWALSQRAYVAAHTGDLARARGDCARALELTERTAYAIPRVWVSAALGLLELSTGNPREAWQACAAGTEIVEHYGIAEPVTLFFVPVAIEAMIGTGQLDRAEALLDMFEDRGRELDRAWALASASRCRALLLAARGDVTAAVGALERAVEQHARLQMPFELARTLLVEGQIRRRGREKRLARAALERAREMFERMHARVWADRARAELARVGLRTAPTALTPTERRVAELAASGMTARVIASVLFVSPKTVQANLARAYAKLGVASRAELGARMATNMGK